MPVPLADQTELLLRMGVALAIGALVGLQRQQAIGGADRELFAGVRTFALMALAGCVTPLVAGMLDSPFVLPVIFGTLGILLVAAYRETARRGDVGLTTEISALLTILAGALCSVGALGIAAALGIATTVLLSLKGELHAFARRLTREDLSAALTLAVISVIVLPLLPNRGFGPPPFDVLNPYRIWLMVVLISAVSFLGYVLFKLVGGRYGIGLTGLLGGLVSSTAVTLSFTQRSRVQPELSRPYALAISLAWTIMLLRVLVIVAALNASLLHALWPPLVAATIAGVGACLMLLLGDKGANDSEVHLANPFELRSALMFGGIYAAILLISNLARLSFGNAGIYLSSVVGGLADVDAITLSMAEFSAQPNGMAGSIATVAILLAAMANTIVKGGIVISSGAPALRRAIAPVLALMILVGGAVALLV